MIFVLSKGNRMILPLRIDMVRRMKRLLLECVLVVNALLLIVSPGLRSQTRVTVGMKSWYAKWNIPFEQVEGGGQSEYSFAFLAGPFLQLRIGNLSGTLMFMRTTIPYQATMNNPGLFDYGYNANVNTTRQDFNLYLNYSVIPELTIFLNGKMMLYKTMMRWRWIDGNKGSSDELLTVAGIGSGVQISIPFSGGSNFYSFISTGGLYNVKISDKNVPTLTELLYFLDSGIGYRFAPSAFGVSFGIRAEAGYYTDVIMGPAANLFYTL